MAKWPTIFPLVFGYDRNQNIYWAHTFFAFLALNAFGGARFGTLVGLVTGLSASSLVYTQFTRLEARFDLLAIPTQVVIDTSFRTVAHLMALSLAVHAGVLDLLLLDELLRTSFLCVTQL